MIALMEAAAVDCVESLLGEGQESLGVRIDVEHTAGTPAGLAVTATAELEEVSGRKLTFYVEARDALEVVGKGRHERVVVDTARFRTKMQEKAIRAG
jgi:predicted thioesterase